MISWLKKHFIPHRGNSHRPHFLRVENARTILVLVVVLELLVFVLPSLTFVARVNHHTNLANVLPGVLAVLTNDEREVNNLPDLVVSPILTKAAEMKAQDMAEKGYFAHTSPEGKTPWYWLDLVGYTYDYAGENLAINFSDSKDVTEAWMNSPTHRANIVKSTYREVGTGIATGMYKGRETIFVAQVYANPRNTSPAPNTNPTNPVVKNTALATVQAPVKKSGNTSSELAVVQTSNQNTNLNTNVLGESVKETEVKETQPIVSSSSLRSKESETSFRAPTSFETIASSPRHALSLALVGMLAIIMVAMVLNIVIKSNIQHPDLITNGLFVTAVIVAVLFTNNYIGTKHLEISQQGIDYSKTQTANVVEVLN